MKWPTRTYIIEEEILLPKPVVWELLANTDHLNRVIGLFRVDPSISQRDESLFYRILKAKAAGVIPIHWKEYPFEWVKEHYYAVERIYTKGPLKRFYGGIELTEGATLLETGDLSTHVKLFADFTPANTLGWLALPVIGKGSMKNTLKYCMDYLKLKKDGKPVRLPQPKQNSKVNETLLNQALNRLAGLQIKRDYISLLESHLKHGGDDELVDMKPYALADRWKTDQEEMLRLFLHATREGILTLSWRLICPNCRVPKDASSSLSTLKSGFHCDLCGIDYDANFDRYVELRFSVHQAIRKAYHSVYCIGGPMITPHVLIQKNIHPGDEVSIYMPEDVDHCRLRILGSNEMVTFKSGEVTIDELSIQNNGWLHNSVAAPEQETILRLHNESKEAKVVVLEKIRWDPLAVTAAKVTTMQEFRDLFSSEVLSPGEQIDIEDVTLFFSDLKGSTTLYENVGDAQAYGNVRKHFDFLTEHISNHSGAVVKTMGDAVMAVFHHPEDAVKAALAIHGNLSELNKAIEDNDKLIVKIGVHHGAAIAVNSNDRIDYFGRTVNIAARIQGESTGDQFVISRSLYNRGNVKDCILGQVAFTEPYDTELKGIDGRFQLVKVTAPNQNTG